MAQGDKSTQVATQEFREHAMGVSKMALIDLVYDLLTRQHGEDQMGRANEFFNEAFGPVAQVRGDRVPKLVKKHLYAVTSDNGQTGSILAWNEEEAKSNAARMTGRPTVACELLR